MLAYPGDFFLIQTFLFLSHFQGGQLVATAKETLRSETVCMRKCASYYLERFLFLFDYTIVVFTSAQIRCSA
jgi:hypothetical protein